MAVPVDRETLRQSIVVPDAQSQPTRQFRHRSASQEPVQQAKITFRTVNLTPMEFLQRKATGKMAALAQRLHLQGLRAKSGGA